MIKALEGIYGYMIVPQRGSSKYLGVYIDFIKEEEVKISMVDYFKWVIINFPEATATTKVIHTSAKLFLA